MGLCKKGDVAIGKDSGLGATVSERKSGRA